uniref:GST N-terminal domain-containing protein n=1 Tax=Alexandrium monilatum TaxID=311494 RepID=A0A7S4Q585_9DINO|mmetsp:Transcript_92723/g.286259  ORF Transcript_92723/g.286259 Transcript_92723/m.286259 type:complete len:360 (+) Transcript_92723:90-1169(+)
MGLYVRLALYACGAVAGPVLVFLLVVALIAMVRTIRFKRKRGWLADRVPHDLPWEFYHSCSVDLDAQKVLCCLAEKVAEFKEREVDMGMFGRFENLEEKMLKVNPNGSQPTLVHDGHPVVGSEEIIRYLDDHNEGLPLLPPDSEERQEIVKWVHLCSQGPVPHLVDKNGSPFMTVGMATRVLSVPVMASAEVPTSFGTSLWVVWKHPNPFPEFNMVTKSLTRHFRRAETVPPRDTSRLCFGVLTHTFDEMEKDLDSNRREFLVGGRFTLADISLMAVLSRLELLGILELLLSDSHPRIQEYYGHMKKRESCRVAFSLKASFPGLEELERCFARFRERVGDQGLVAAFRLDEDRPEEEED